MPERAALLVMAYGTPRDLDDVEAYYTDIRHGRPPPPELLHELRERYRAIGGRSPLLELTKEQARGIAERVGLDAYVGQKHAAPFIPDAIEQMMEDGVTRAVGLVLAPHFSTMSIGDYKRRARAAAAETGWGGRIDFVDSWHLEPGYVDFLTREVARAVRSLPSTPVEKAVVLFTAHSLPEKILQAGDPYPRQLEETARAVAQQAGLSNWQVGWQSAGRTDVPWLGPDILEMLPRLAADAVRGVVICPCGFVADHLEVLYDIDIEAQAAARDLDIELARTRSPNADPHFLDALATVVKRAFAREA